MQVPGDLTELFVTHAHLGSAHALQLSAVAVH